MPDIIMYILSTIVPAIGGVIIYLVKKHFKHLEKTTADAEERRCQKDLLVLKTLKSIGELCVANSIALQQGHTNGEVSSARQQFEEIDKELNNFLIESTVKKVNSKK